MEVKTGLLVIIVFTVSVTMLVIFLGCNQYNELFNENGSTPQELCEGSDGQQIFDKCMKKKMKRDNLCNDYFSWIKLVNP